MYSYLILFILLLVGGETILVPAVYLALIGKLEIIPLVIITWLSTAISDSAWHLAGRYLPKEKIFKLPFLKTKKDNFESVKENFNKYDHYYVILSKFVYGFRILVQIFSGMIKMKYWKFVLFNITGTTIWMAILFGIGFLLKSSLQNIELAVQNLQIIFAITFVIIIILIIWISKRISRKKFQ